MQIRQLRIVPQGPPPSPAPSGMAVPLAAPPTGAALDVVAQIMPDPEWTDRQFTIFLLQTAADIEHSLLVQYLYTAYSIRTGLAIPNSARTTDNWKRTILDIAR